MLRDATVAAIFAFCSVSSAAPAWSSSMPGTGTYPITSGTAAGSSGAAIATAPIYSNSVTYQQAEQATDSSSTAADTAMATGPPSTPTDLGLTKTQQILLSDSRVDVFNNVLRENKDFVFDFNAKRKFGPGKGGEVVQANRKTFPAITDTAIGMAVGFLGPCGFNTPHVHPRATEFLIVTKGRLVSEMFVENGVRNADGTPRNVINTIEELQATPYYQGALHSQFNPTCDNVTFIGPQSSDDFGANTMAQAFFALGDDTIAAVAGNSIDGAEIDKFRGMLSVNVAEGVQQCLDTCFPKKDQ
ncbi:Uu.00g010480.m01.CDS01 [Anthostomella pinea]|uniref:Uu.00g010480.m01.CDS01 n=1 Tax=Anthostomella pinea TaxID=933095 RepID=A0AAI8VY92_9PEZI|nr:Uu.00g010480.m01.CDS01 [Anthostomella pinea]